MYSGSVFKWQKEEKESAGGFKILVAAYPTWKNSSASNICALVESWAPSGPYTACFKCTWRASIKPGSLAQPQSLLVSSCHMDLFLSTWHCDLVHKIWQRNHSLEYVVHHAAIKTMKNNLFDQKKMAVWKMKNIC